MVVVIILVTAAVVAFAIVAVAAVAAVAMVAAFVTVALCVAVASWLTLALARWSVVVVVARDEAEQAWHWPGAALLEAENVGPLCARGASGGERGVSSAPEGGLAF